MFHPLPRIILTSVFLTLLITTASAATIHVPVGGNLQAAINTAKCGDVITLEAGATYTGNFNLGPKPVCTGTDGDYITITTNDPSGTPVHLTNYPRSDTPTTTASAARMPKAVTPNSYPAFWLNGGMKYWRIKGLDITSVKGARAIRLIGFGEVIPADRSQYPDHIVIEQNWIHPPEEDGTPLTTANMHRSVDNGIYFEGTNTLIQHNDIGGFVGRYADSNQPMTTAGILITTWADNVVIQNNYIRAWTYGFFFGGGSKGFATVTATVTNCTTTSCQFSSTNGITIGKAITVLVYKAVDSIGIEREWWGQGFVSAINGSTVTVSRPWCHSNNDPNGNVCRPFTSANLRQFPADGALARIEGLQPQNITVRRNYISKRPEWKELLGQSGGKGYFELKACHNCTVDGNIFDHGTGSTITTRNQGGADPWNDLDGLRYTNNWSKRCNAVFTGYLQDGANLTNRSQNVLFENNLCVGPLGEPAGWEWMLITSNVLSGADNVTIRNNTELIAKYRNYTSYADAPIRGMVNKDNIHRASGGACFTTGAGESGSPWSDCWPGADVSGNVLVNIDNNPLDEIRNAWITPYPSGGNVITTLAGVGFIDPTLDALGNYRLRDDSLFKGKGADIDKMNAAIFGSGPIPQPTPMPSVSPTPAPSPVASPTPIASPSPVVTPTPMPTPSPVSSPTPAPQPATSVPAVLVYVRDGDLPVGGALVSVAGQSMLSRADDGFAWFDKSPTPLGSVITVTKDGYSFPSATVIAGTVEQLYFVVGRQVAQPSPTPVATPTPQPSPTIEPSPLPSPSPSPTILPTPVPSPSVGPSPAPTPPPVACEMAITAPIMAQWSSGVLIVSLTTPLPSSFTITVSPDSGQLTVTPRSQSFSNVASLTTQWKVQSKKKSANVTIVGPCGSKTVFVRVE